MSPSSRRGGRSEPAEPPEQRGAGTGGGDGQDGRQGQATVLLAALAAPYARLAAGAGIAYALVGIVGLSLLPPAKVRPDDPAAAIAAQLVADRGRVSAGVLLTMFGAFFLLVFVAWLHRYLRQAEGEDGWLATLALSGGLLLAAALLFVVVVSLSSTVLDDYGPDPVIARTLLILRVWAAAIALIPAAVFTGAVGLVGWRSGWLPRWLSYAGIALAVGMLVLPLASVPFLLSTLWIGMLSVVLLQQARAAR